MTEVRRRRGLFTPLRALTRFLHLRRQSSSSSEAEQSQPLNDLKRASSRVSEKDGHKLFDRQISQAVPSIGPGAEGGLRATKGEIQFYTKNFQGEDVVHQYLLTPHTTAMEEIEHTLQAEWGMATPRMVLFVISNANHLNPNNNIRQLKNLAKGIVKAANTTETWVVTTGLNIGIFPIIAKEFAKERRNREMYKCRMHGHHHGKTSQKNLVLLGVTRDDFLNSTPKLEASVQTQGKVKLENEGNFPEEKKFDLNIDHSHFIIVKDLSVNRKGYHLFVDKWIRMLLHGSESVSRDKVSNTILSFGHESLNTMSIPVVSIVIQGGYDCLILVEDLLRRENPVVVIRGTGGISDILAFTYDLVHSSDKRFVDSNYIEDFVKPELNVRISEDFPQFRESLPTRNHFRDLVIDCVTKYSQRDERTFLTIMDINSYQCNLDNTGEYVLRAIFKSQKADEGWEAGQMQRDLVLALDWNSPDLALAEVFRKNPTQTFQVSKVVFEHALKLENREKFISLFLKEGFQLYKFLSKRQHEKLYHHILDQEFFRTVCWEGVLGYAYPLRPKDDFVKIELNWLIQQLCDIKNVVSEDELGQNAAGLCAGGPVMARRKSVAILSLWAVFADKSDLAKTLWAHSDEPVHLALILSMIYERLHYYVTEPTRRKKMEELSKDFSNMATGVLDDSYNFSLCHANEVLSEKSGVWGNKTALDIAAVAGNRTFMSHQCCQKLLTGLFMGSIRIRDMAWGPITFPEWIKVISCALFILPMYFWIIFLPSGKEEVKLEKEFSKDEIDAEDDYGVYFENNMESNLINRSALRVDEEQAGTAPSIPPPTPAPPSKNKNATMVNFVRTREVFVRSQPPIYKMIYLMWSAPITKFWMFQLFYMMYLSLFSVAVLWPSCGNYYLDLSVCTWTALIVLENVRRSIILYRKYHSVPLFLKVLEILLITSFVGLYFCLRILYVNTVINSYSTKVILCCGLLYFFFRLIVIYLPISPTLGPLLYRIKFMVFIDFMNFMRMTLLVIISCGIVIHTVLYPDYPISLELFRRIFHRAWFTLYLTPVDDLDPKVSINCERRLNNDTCLAGAYLEYTCPNTGIWPYIFSVQYFILLKLILITLLTALFSATAARLSAESDAIWKFQRYRLVMDFEARLRLPAPLSAISFVIIFFKYVLKMFCAIFKLCRDQTDGVKKEDEPVEYSYWQNLAQEYSRREEKKNTNVNPVNDLIDKMEVMADDLENLKHLMRYSDIKQKEMQLRSDLMLANVERILNMSEKMLSSGSVDDPQRPRNTISRSSPYPGTSISRFPVPNKYVSWDLLWVAYDPVAYSRPRNDFPGVLQGFVDEDILLLRHIQDPQQQLPVLQWNCSVENAAGITIDRKSWIIKDGTQIIYKLDTEGLPRNPVGRTGLRGRGELPRWGPNHYVLVIITRTLRSRFGSGLEVVMMSTEVRNKLVLPGGFVPGDLKYEAVRAILKQNDPMTSSVWRSHEDMDDFFRGCHVPTSPAVEAENAKSECIYQGYMDDEMNTDQAWKEVELWHIHYPGDDILQEKILQPKINWKRAESSFFKRVPRSHMACLNRIPEIHRLKLGED